MDLCEFEVSLVYRTSSRNQELQRDPVLKDKQTKNPKKQKQKLLTESLIAVDVLEFQG